MSVIDHARLAVTPIHNEMLNGGMAVGTGFFFNFGAPNTIQHTALITNKHVVEDAANLTIWVRGSATQGGQADRIFSCNLILNRDDLIVHHPNPNIDLCAIPTSLFDRVVNAHRYYPTRAQFKDSNLPNERLLPTLFAREQVTMVGYPNGISDDVSQAPILREGVTATPIGTPFRGKDQFVVDIPSVGGSSGSPILIANDGSWSDRTGPAVYGGHRYYVVGCLYAGFESANNVLGTGSGGEEVSLGTYAQDLHLGLAISSLRIMDLRSLFLDRVDNPHGVITNGPCEVFDLP